MDICNECPAFKIVSSCLSSQHDEWSGNYDLLKPARNNLEDPRTSSHKVIYFVLPLIVNKITAGYFFKPGRKYLTLNQLVTVHVLCIDLSMGLK